MKTNSLIVTIAFLFIYLIAYAQTDKKWLIIDNVIDILSLASSSSDTEEYIAYFNTSNISGYVASSSRHAVIVQRANSDGSLSIFDPQKDSCTTIPASEAHFVNQIMF